MSRETAYGLSLAGGIITLLIGIFVVLVSIDMGAWMGMMSRMPFAFGGIARAAVALFGIWGVVVGIIILLGANIIKENDTERARGGSILVLIFSILGLITFQGLFIGPILALVGGAIGLGATSADTQVATRTTARRPARRRR